MACREYTHRYISLHVLSMFLLLPISGMNLSSRLLPIPFITRPVAFVRNYYQPYQLIYHDFFRQTALYSGTLFSIHPIF